MNTSNVQPSPFGGDAMAVGEISTKTLELMYRNKCGADVSRHFGSLPALGLYECAQTGMRFWRPASVAGDEAFYADLSNRWPHYYQTDRWEYQPTRAAIPIGARVLEVGCGRGYFLRSLESHAGDAMGLEFNNDAIKNKVTRFDVRNQFVEDLLASDPKLFDVVCSFQVLEHVSDPAAFVRSCLACLRPGGLLILSTPNYDMKGHRRMEDAFDLPPHHLNHFDADAYRRMAALLGLTVLSLTSQQVAEPVRQLRISDAHSSLQRRARLRINRTLLRTFGTQAGSGHTLLAVMQN